MVCREGGWEAIFAADFTLAPHIEDELRNGEQHAPHIEDEPQNEEQHAPHIEDEPWNGEQHAPDYEDEIAGLQKRPFLAGFFYFFGRNFFLQAAHLYGQTVYILQKNCLQMSFPRRREAPNILLPPLEGSHRLLNWQIQVIKSQLSRAIN